MQGIFDSHFHFDFLRGLDRRQTFMQEMDKHKIDIFAQTVLPSDYRDLVTQDKRPEILGLGYHPWWIEANGLADQLAIFQQMISQTRYIGEIGLDFSDSGLSMARKELQVAVLVDLLFLIKEQAQVPHQPFILSIHAVKSVSTILDIFENLQFSPREVLPIFHWFSGTSQDLTRIIKAGGYFSINPRMLQSKKGRSYVHQIPQELLLLESDWPVSPIESQDQWDQMMGEYPSLLSHLLSDLSHLRGQEMGPILDKNYRQVFRSGSK